MSLLYPAAYLQRLAYEKEHVWVIESPCVAEVEAIKYWWLLIWMPSGAPKLTMVTLKPTNGKEEKEYSNRPGFSRCHVYLTDCKHSQEEMKGGLLLFGPQQNVAAESRQKIIAAATWLFSKNEFVKLDSQHYTHLLSVMQQYISVRSV